MALVLATWVFFRAESLPQALAYLGHMFGLGGNTSGAALVGATLYQPGLLLVMGLCVLVHILKLDTWDIAGKLQPAKLVTAAVALTVSLAVMFSQSYNPFLYFRF